MEENQLHLQKQELRIDEERLMEKRKREREGMNWVCGISK
jgi:hypothetical protein